jgi:hypothetical protein
MRYQRRQAIYEARDTLKKGAFHASTAKSKSAADIDDKTDESIHVAYGRPTARADNSPRISAPAP